MNQKKAKVIKAWASVDTKTGEIGIDYMGAQGNEYLRIHPNNKKGELLAEGGCNGYQTPVQVEITIKIPKPHKCNCMHCHYKLPIISPKLKTK